MPDLFGYEPPVVSPTVEAVPVEVCELFERFAIELKGRGWSSYSADAILHRIRWHYHVEKGIREFKCNNNWTSALARWLIKKRPEMQGFFELRALAEERNNAKIEGKV
jgi:hypothetical protein